MCGTLRWGGDGGMREVNEREGNGVMGKRGHTASGAGAVTRR